MTETNIAPCPNPECRSGRSDCHVTSGEQFPGGTSLSYVGCDKGCGYLGPHAKGDAKAYSLNEQEAEAIRLHNALCRSDALVKELEELEAEIRADGNQVTYGYWDEGRNQGCIDSADRLHALISKHRKGT